MDAAGTMMTSLYPSVSLTIPPATLPTETQNTSFQHDCVVLKQMAYSPWDNPDNIVSLEVEEITSRIKQNMLGFLFLIGGPANIMNMAVFYRQGLNARVNMCLFSLALADELFLIASIPFNGEQLITQFTTGEKNSPLQLFMIENNLTGLLGFSFVSAVLSAIIAVERCHCVFNPLTFQTAMRNRTMAVIIIIVYVVVMGLFFLVVAFRFRSGCVYDPASDVILKEFFLGHFYQAHKELLDALHSAVFGVGIPFLVTLVVAVTTVITAVKLRQIVMWRAEASASISLREVALTKMLIGSSILFIVCIIPTAVSRNTSLFSSDINTGGRHENLFMTMVWVGEAFTFINSSLNIFVYYAMGSRYRETFWKILGRKGAPEQKASD